MKDPTQLLDKLLAAEGSDGIEPTLASGKRTLYPEVSFLASNGPSPPFTMIQYLPTTALLAGVKVGSLHQGHFNANPYNYLEGTVPIPALIFDKNEWKAPADEVVDQDPTLKDDNAEISEGDVDENGTEEVRARDMKVGHNEARNSDKQPTGKVVG